MIDPNDRVGSHLPPEQPQHPAVQAVLYDEERSIPALLIGPNSHCLTLNHLFLKFHCALPHQKKSQVTWRQVDRWIPVV